LSVVSRLAGASERKPLLQREGGVRVEKKDMGRNI
jgi:hypothetical protein